MKREDLIKKWLDDELNSLELQAFQELEEFEELTTLSNNLMRFKAPEYNTSEELNSVLHQIKSSNSKQTSTNWLRPVLRIAAVIAIMFSVYYYSTTLDTSFETQMAQKTELVLPDDSEVSLNALSSLTFNKHDWKNQRDVALKGEAYFKVAKGSKFNVKTATGTVTVLGTEFNVKQRENYFEVTCFEGSVKVVHSSDIVVLKPGDSFLKINGKLIAREKETLLQPSWMHNESSFKSMPFSYVLRELERQYNVRINPQNIDLEQLFTGSFGHDNIEMALKSITLPLNVKYNFKNKTTIELSRD